MKIVVIGGSGRIGSKLVRRLQRDHCHVRVASPTSGVDAFTGEGLWKAIAGAEVVVDCSNPPPIHSADPENFFETAGQKLVEAEQRAGVTHHIILSIVGIERLLAGDYFRGKKRQEDIIIASGLGFTIVRSTQFFEFISGVVQEGGPDAIPIAPVLVQPIAARDVARFLGEAAIGEALNATVEIAGPEQLHLDELATEIATLHEDWRSVVADVHAPYFGTRLQERSLLPDRGARVGQQRFDEWLRSTIKPFTHRRWPPWAASPLRFGQPIAPTGD